MNFDDTERIDPGNAGKKRWPAALGRQIGNTLVELLAPYCLADRVCIAGSLRRLKPEVGDVEILYAPKFGPLRNPGEMFESDTNLAEAFISSGLLGGKLIPRLNENGTPCWGKKNKLATHKATGMPVDLFSTPPENWWVALVIRTGPKESNIQLIEAAKRRGLQLHAYGAYTEIASGAAVIPQSEAEVFELAGLKFVPPEER